MRKQSHILLILIGALLLAACGQATAAAPTPAATMDLNPLRTEVAATVLAQCAAVCALTPSPTLPPTVTPQPSPTAAEMTATAATPAAAVTGTVVAGTGTPAASLDQAKWVSQLVMDGTVFAPGQDFTMSWRLENVGKTTWTAGYRLRYFSGELFGAPREIALNQDVAPGQQVDITVQMKAPAKLGKYRSDWVMSNESLYNFNQPVYLEITVANPPTATASPTIAPTATSTPQELTPAPSPTP